MKSSERILCFILLQSMFIVGFVCKAQSQNLVSLETVYMKDGMVFTGVIEELITDSIVTIRTNSNVAYVLKMKDVERIVKEFGEAKRPYVDRSPPPRPVRDTVKYVYTHRPKGYFFQGQLITEYQQFGMTMIHGHKFNRFAHLGLGVGFNLFFEPLIVIPDSLTKKRSKATAVHLPFFVHLGGDIMTTQTTPYYALELGYAVIANANAAERNGRSAIYASLGFGIRMYSTRKFHTSFGVYANLKNHDLTYSETYRIPSGQWITEQKTGNTTNITVGIRMIMGI